MSAWRRKALALFPELQDELKSHGYSVYMLYFDLDPMVREAHEHDDREKLRRIYGFAEWCFSQKEKELWNAAGVAFYEHLFDMPHRLWDKVIPWLSPYVIRNVQGLWEWRLGKDRYQKLVEALAAWPVFKAREKNVFSTGEIENI